MNISCFLSRKSNVYETLTIDNKFLSQNLVFFFFDYFPVTLKVTWDYLRKLLTLGLILIVRFVRPVKS